MGRRHRAREAALQCLYQWEVTGAAPERILEGFWQSRGAVDAQVRLFAEALVHGVVTQAAEIDAMISDQTEHWRMDRLGLVEKSILRLGVYELAFDEQNPAAVVINEAVELAKRFSGPEAGPFINGVLDGIRQRIAAGSVSDA